MPLGYSSPVLNAPQSYDARRRKLVGDLASIAGKVPVAGWLPHRNDALVSVDPWSGRVWTAEATMQGRLTPQGKGVGLTYNGSTNLLSTPDTNDTSFGNSVTDSPFTLFTVWNVTDTANVRVLYGKWITAAPEYLFFLNTDDTIALRVNDQSVAATASATSSAGISQGAVHSYAATYSAATGGATAASDMTIYQDGASVALTLTQAPTYVAMENLTQGQQIGAAQLANGQGVAYLSLTFAGALTAAQIAALHNRARAYWGF